MTTKVIALIGANGQLGTDIYKVLSKDSSFRVCPLFHRDIEIGDANSINKALEAIEPDIVINTAAYHSVDDVESHPQQAFLVNTIAPMFLAQYCEGHKATFVSISTDYVFGQDNNRSTPYREQDCTGPINMYGISKLAGELAIQQNCSRYFILRTSGLFGVAGPSGKGGRNFIETMIKLAKEKKHIRVVNDQLTAPTHTVDLAHQIKALLQTNEYGLYHASALEGCSWFDFAKAIFAFTSTEVSLEAVLSSAFPMKAKRPGYTVLDDHMLRTKKLLIMHHWRDGLRSYLLEKRYIGRS